MLWLRLAIALTGIIIGFAIGWRVIKRARRPSVCDDRWLFWDEEPISVWHQDWTIASFIALHSTSIVILAALFLLDIIWHVGTHTLLPFDATPFISGAERSQFRQTLETIVTGGVGLAWFICGALLAFRLLDAGYGPFIMGLCQTAW